ncbi:hypothetical protein EAE99_010677 [Botrytis elliptica]|nr:hypothetical protein EAE99_010677 [Botrytis elliptica]
MYSPNSPSNQFHLNNCLFKFTNIPSDFSRPLPPPLSPPRPPPPLSYLAGHNLPVSVPELSEDTVLRASLDGNLDDIHYPANLIPDPRSSTETPQISHHIISSPSPTSLSHQPRITMAPPQLSRSATSPDLSAPSTISPMPELQEYAPNRDGAISRTDRYSRVLPAMPPHPLTAPPPIPTIPSSSSSTMFHSSRPSGLRHVTFAHETDTLSLTSSHPSQTSSSILPSNPTSPPRKHRFNLTLAHQKMQKAFSTLRTHTHSISPKPSLLLRKKSSHSTLFTSDSGSGSGSSPLSASDVSADEPTRPKTAPSSSSSFGFGNFPAMPGAFSKDKRDARGGKEMQIGAPTGMVKKTPEEIQQMLREMGVKSEDLFSVVGSSTSTIHAPSHSAGDDGNDTNNTASPSPFQSTIQEPLALPPNSPRPETPRVLSAVQRGKLPALSAFPHSFTRPTRSSSLSSPHCGPSVPFPVRDLTTKPVGWFSTAPMDDIRATLAPTRKEDFLKPDEMDGFLAQLVEDFGVIVKVRKWRSDKLDEEIERLRECAVEGEEEVEEDDDDDDEGDDDIEDGEAEEEEEPYIWGANGEPHPDFVDGGWGQEEISSAGVGARWFVFDDMENVLGGPKCPITHAVDGFEDAEQEQEQDGGDGGVAGEEREMLDEEMGRGEMSTTLLSPIEEGFGEEEGEEGFDEDARQLSQEEILKREGLL